MMPIAINEQFSDDLKVKQRAAVKQMGDLCVFLENSKQYATLSISDRQVLIKKRFANDLVDNLVFYTERQSADLKVNNQDKLVVGFTHSAFDTSLYADETIKNLLHESHNGCCAYCEMPIYDLNSACISHHQPAWGSNDGTQWQRTLYYKKAYQADNLLYSCNDCYANKGSAFPQEVPSDQALTKKAQDLLVNPYLDKPRQHIRFNPLDAQAYAYDNFSLYCQKKYNLKESEIESYIWQNPQLISQYKADKTAQNRQSKGQITIEVLGLNRPSLIKARIRHLQNLRTSLYSGKQEDGNDNGEITQIIKDLNGGQIKQNQYYGFNSLTIDALMSWQSPTKKTTPPDWLAGYQTILDEAMPSPNYKFLPWFESGLQYMVLETELNLENRRRLVYLHSSDYIYGSDRKVKSVFLPINWQSDIDNVVKIHNPEGQYIWQSTFKELAQTHITALQSLFADNEIWVEGHYKALA